MRFPQYPLVWFPPRFNPTKIECEAQHISGQSTRCPLKVHPSQPGLTREPSDLSRWVLLSIMKDWAPLWPAGRWMKTGGRFIYHTSPWSNVNHLDVTGKAASTSVMLNVLHVCLRSPPSGQELWLTDVYLRISADFKDMGCGDKERWIWGRNEGDGESPDKPGVVSVDWISGGLLQACVEKRCMNNWKGTEGSDREMQRRPRTETESKHTWDDTRAWG